MWAPDYRYWLNVCVLTMCTDLSSGVPPPPQLYVMFTLVCMRIERIIIMVQSSTEYEYALGIDVMTDRTEPYMRALNSL